MLVLTRAGGCNALKRFECLRMTRPGNQRWLAGKSPINGGFNGQWIGLRETLQENTKFDGKFHGFL